MTGKKCEKTEKMLYKTIDEKICRSIIITIKKNYTCQLKSQNIKFKLIYNRLPCTALIDYITDLNYLLF